MSYQTQSELFSDLLFRGRVLACAFEQAQANIGGAADVAALAVAVMRAQPDELSAWERMVAGAPGLGDKVDKGDGTIDQSQVTDADILAAVQGNWQKVASLYFNTDGTVKS